jgi:hypothetical protein
MGKLDFCSNLAIRSTQELILFLGKGIVTNSISPEIGKRNIN